MNRNHSLRTALAIVQMMALLAVHGLGAVVGVEIEHQHPANGDHHHHGHGHLPLDLHDHSHHEHPAPCDGHEEDGTSDKGETHTHQVSITVDSPVTCKNFIAENPGSGQRICLDPLTCEQGPESPSFELVKPPQ